MTTIVHVEGGGDRHETRARCRQGFSEFFRKAGLSQRSVRVVADGPRSQAYKRFKADVERSSDFFVLLVDSEAPVKTSNTWDHLRIQDGWVRPAGSADDDAYLMVQCMEAWLVADPQALADYFGAGFRSRAIPRRNNVEGMAVKDLLSELRAASRGSSKGSYDKGKHSFALLAKVDPKLVAGASPHAKRLIDALHQHT